MAWQSHLESLPVHQREGFRFILKKFKKKAKGVILNDPSGYGKRLQVVQFLVAIQSLITKPVLILCPDKHTVKSWVEQFHKWTTLSDYITVESSNIFAASNKVFINEIENMRTFSRRHWSVLIVNDDFVDKDLLSNTLKADFKIWVTSEDMKKNLETFYLIYKWINPDVKWKISDIIAKTSKPTDILSQNIKVDYFLEEIVLRRNCLPKLFEVAKKPEPMVLESPKKSKKNKDATGTKIKRSKCSLGNVNKGPGSSTEASNSTATDIDKSQDKICHKNISDQGNTKITNDNQSTNALPFKFQHDNSLNVASCNRNALVNVESEITGEFENGINDGTGNVTTAKIICNKGRLIFDEGMSQSQADNKNEVSVVTELSTIKNNSSNKVKDTEIAEDHTNITVVDRVTGALEEDYRHIETNVNSNNTTVIETQNDSDINLQYSEFCDKTNPSTENLEETHVLKDTVEHKTDQMETNIKENNEKESSKHKLDENDALSEFERNLLKRFKGSALDRLF